MRVIVLILTSTGIRIGGLAGLKISSLKKIEEFGLTQKNTYASQLLNVLQPLTFI